MQRGRCQRARCALLGGLAGVGSCCGVVGRVVLRSSSAVRTQLTRWWFLVGSCSDFCRAEVNRRRRHRASRRCRCSSAVVRPAPAGRSHSVGHDRTRQRSRSPHRRRAAPRSARRWTPVFLRLESGLRTASGCRRRVMDTAGDGILASRQCTSHVYVIDAGSIVFSGSWAAFDADPAVRERYLGV